MAFTTTALAVLTASSAISKFASDRKQGIANERMAEHEAGLLEENARLAEAQAADSLVRGKLEEYKVNANLKELIGAQRANMAAQGISIDSGSALDLQLEAAGLGEIDRVTARNNAAREAWGYKIQAADYRARAGLSRMRGGRGSDYGTLLTGAAQVADIYREK